MSKTETTFKAMRAKARRKLKYALLGGTRAVEQQPQLELKVEAEKLRGEQQSPAPLRPSATEIAQSQQQSLLDLQRSLAQSNQQLFRGTVGQLNGITFIQDNYANSQLNQLQGMQSSPYSVQDNYRLRSYEPPQNQLMNQALGQQALGQYYSSSAPPWAQGFGAQVIQAMTSTMPLTVLGVPPERPGKKPAPTVPTKELTGRRMISLEEEV